MPTTQDTFKTDAPHGRIVSGGLKANLAANREETLRWVEEAPLRLVAAALLDAHRRTAKVGELRQALTTEVIESGKWNSWWNVVRPGLQKSRRFTFPKRGEIMLHTRILSEVEFSSLAELRALARGSKNGAAKTNDSTAAATTAKTSASIGKANKSARATQRLTGQFAWAAWVWAKEEKPTPNPAPPSDFPKFLHELEEDTGKVVSRLVSGIRQRLLGAKQKPGDKTIESWHESLVAALNRWSNLSDPLDALPLEDVVVVTARVVDELGRSEFQDVVAWMAEYTSIGESAVKAMSDTILSASSETPDGTALLLSRLRDQLDKTVRQNLWRQLLKSKLNQQTESRLIKRWLDLLSIEESADAITYLLSVAQDRDSATFLDLVLWYEWERSNSTQRTRLSDAVTLSWQLQHQQSITNGFELNGTKPTPLMGDWLKVLEPDDRYEVMAYLLRTVRDENLNEAIVPVFESELGRADTIRRFRLLDDALVGNKTLSGYVDEVIREAVAGLAQNGLGMPQDTQPSELQRRIREAARVEIECVRDCLTRKLEVTKRKLDKATGKAERYTKQVRHLQHEINKDRYGAAFDLSHDAIMILGNSLRELDTLEDSTSTNGNLKAKAVLALLSIGAEQFGELGNVVEFDPSLHESESPIMTGAPARVIARGVRYFRGEDTPRTMIRMKVKAEENR